MAQKVVEDFGIATECGTGRTPMEAFDTIMGILGNCSGAVV